MSATEEETVNGSGRKSSVIGRSGVKVAGITVPSATNGVAASAVTGGTSEVAVSKLAVFTSKAGEFVFAVDTAAVVVVSGRVSSVAGGGEGVDDDGGAGRESPHKLRAVSEVRTKSCFGVAMGL